MEDEGLDYPREAVRAAYDRGVADERARCAALRERLAALCHDQWSGWMRHLFSKCQTPAPTGNIYIPRPPRERWQRQMNTPYAELSESEKDSDRKEADRILEALGQEGTK